MAVFRFWPAACLWIAAALLAWLSRRVKWAGRAAFCSVLFTCALILLILMEGGGLAEGLACLLPILFLMLPGEKRHEL